VANEPELTARVARLPDGRVAPEKLPSAVAALVTLVEDLSSRSDLVGERVRARGFSERDNVTLAEDQRAHRDLTRRLERQIELGELVDGQVQYLLEREVPADDPRRSVIEQDILFRRDGPVIGGIRHPKSLLDCSGKNKAFLVIGVLTD
jgi:hypothetical protein